MSVCDPHTGMHTLYHGRLPSQYFLPRPVSRFDGAFLSEDADALTSFFAEYGASIAGFLIEPIVQGAGGMWFYHPEYVRLLAELCRTYEVLLIADEIATGFGRTGEWFALNHADVSPDVMCVGKALTGGYVSFAATLCSDAVADAIDAATPGVLMHGPTFMGNPLACAVACESVAMLQEGQWQAQVAMLARVMSQELSPLRTRAFVRDVRVLGAIGVVELQEAVDLATIVPLFVAAGVWIRPFGRLVYVMPPFVMPEDVLRQLLAAMVDVLDRVGAMYG